MEKFVPAEAVLGYYIPFYILDYPLFGENLTRRLVPMVSPAQLSDIQWLRDEEIEYILLPDRDDYPAPPRDYGIQAEWEGWTLYVYAPIP